MRRARLKLVGLTAVAALFVAGCTSEQPTGTTQAAGSPSPKLASCGTQGDGDVTLYSARKESLLKPIVAGFEGTGGKVATKEGKGAELVAALIEEKKSPRADAFIGQDAGSLEELRDKDVFCAAKVEGSEKLPDRFKASDGSWYGVSGRARVLIVNTDLVPAAQIPKSVFDLAKPEWKGKLAMASSSEGSVVAWVTAMRKVAGEAKTKELLEGLKANDVKLLAGHTDVRKSVASGETAVGLVNHYYYYIQKAETPDAPIAIVYTDQEPGQIGVLVNVSGIGVVQGGKNPGPAQKFASYLLTPEAQKTYAEVNYEYPLMPGTEAAPGIRPLKDVRQMDVNLEELGDAKATLALFDQVGFK